MPKDIIVKSNDYGYVRLNDYRVELNKIRFGVGNMVVYHRASRVWSPITRNTPLPVHHCGELIFVKNQDVTFANGLTEMLFWDGGAFNEEQPEVLEISSEDESVYLPPIDRKGKGRTF